MRIDKVENVDANDNSPLKAIIDGIECWVPRNIENRHYREIVKQQREGKIDINLTLEGF